jgi:DNA primase
MEISEEVLFSTLAQLSKRDNNSSPKRTSEPLKVVTQKSKAPKVDVQYHLERKIIEILLLYGKKAEDFEDLVLKEDEDSGELKLEPQVVNLKVFDKIYMDLQEDEMLFSNQIFQDLYHNIITAYGQSENFSTTNFINGLNQNLAIEVTSILMDDEKYNLHDWERNNIITKGKEDSIAQLVTQTILNLRCFLIDKKVIEFKQKTLEPESDSRIIMEDVKDYLSLKMLLSRKLGRVVGNNLS